MMYIYREKKNDNMTERQRGGNMKTIAKRQRETETHRDRETNRDRDSSCTCAASHTFTTLPPPHTHIHLENPESQRFTQTGKCTKRQIDH